MIEEANEFDFENRIISNEYDSIEDGEVENCLRPKTLSEYVGQTKAKSNLKVYIESAKMTTFFFTDLPVLVRLHFQQ